MYVYIEIYLGSLKIRGLPEPHGSPRTPWISSNPMDPLEPHGTPQTPWISPKLMDLPIVP